MINKEQIKSIKQLFYTYRNGLIADNIRKAGDEHKIIFGLNIPQIQDIAKTLSKDAELAEWLWNNSTTRESQLLAPLLYPIEYFTKDIALQWINTMPNYEIADNLCHKLLRNASFAEELIWENIYTIDSKIGQYTYLRLLLNLITLNRIIDKNKLQYFINSYNLPAYQHLIFQQIREYMTEN